MCAIDRGQGNADKGFAGLLLARPSHVLRRVRYPIRHGIDGLPCGFFGLKFETCKALAN